MNTSKRLQITIEPSAHAILRSITLREPEEYAVLAGNLDDPFHIIEARAMPPMANRNGQANAGHAHVQLNADYVGHYLNRELVPFRKYLLGIMHTHPAGIRHLSGGVTGSGYGDIPSMRGTLERAATSEPRWQNFLAPIGTLNSDGEPELTGWVIRLDEPEPIPATIIVATRTPNDNVILPQFPVEALVQRAGIYQQAINSVLADETSPQEHRKWFAGYLHDLRQHDLNDERTRLLARLDRHA